ncbi:hypothetical protein [Thermoactinomyces sp. DSM 45892]|uniref:hypothetical protein n=2 Tax=unclassified Thermoactinomyces TaxID=2634588 RepID=UPI00089CEBE2|nr:hypothetical protein [Thermoactinomyces sp. DSM 45892]SDY71816.1 hypothetical protein SAMN05444416_107164 [Thermoactinomyces sp. DSM 45892]
MYGSSLLVRQLTGVQPTTFKVSDSELDAILVTWLVHISAEVDQRLGESVQPSDARWQGIESVVIRTVSKLVGYAVQSRTSKVVQVGEFAVKILNASDVVKDLDWELRPYQKRQLSLFHSGSEWRI